MSSWEYMNEGTERVKETKLRGGQMYDTIYGSDTDTVSSETSKDRDGVTDAAKNIRVYRSVVSTEDDAEETVMRHPRQRTCMTTARLRQHRRR